MTLQKLKNLSRLNQERTDHFLSVIDKRPILVVIFNLLFSFVIRASHLVKKVLKALASRKNFRPLSYARNTVPEEALPGVGEGGWLQLPTSSSVPENPSILLVVEESLNACFRYRVRQKIEQCESLGWQVRWVSWKDSHQARRMIHFAHIVIFYRVPAFPGVVATIRHARALNKITFFDIDDLVFDVEHYPGPYENFRKTLSRNEYQELINGVDLYQEALSLCSYGIASTPALAEKMEKQVEARKSFVHRNGLDRDIVRFASSKPDRHSRPFVTIFYGSGTRTHDADFQIAAGALGHILEHSPNVRLIIAGPLSLPDELEAVKDRIDRIPFLNQTDVYWEILSQADINIAPLKEGVFEDCKSEIKWLEAAYLNVPSVVSATRTYREILEDGEDVLLASNPREWKEKLQVLIEDAGLRSRIARRASERARARYDCKVLAENLGTIIQATIRHESLRGRVHVSPVSKSRLLFVNVLYPPQGYGGATAVMNNTVRELARNHSHFEPYVFTYDLERGSDYGLSEYIWEDVHVARIGIPPVPNFDWQYSNDDIYRVFSEYLDFVRPDLIHFHSIQRLTASVATAAFDKKIPYIVTLHDAWWISDHQFLVDQEGNLCDPVQNDPVLLLRTASDLTAAIQRRRFLAKVLRQADVVLAVSEFQADLYRRNGFDNVLVDKNGILPVPGPAPSTAAGGRLRIGYAGGVCIHKGYFLLRDAIISSGLSNTEVMIIDFSFGPGQERRDSWGTTPVMTTGKIPAERMYADFFSRIDVLAVPSLAPESYGLIVREAMMAGVWVIVSRRGALAEDIIEGVNGFTFDPDAPGELIAILRNLEKNASRFKERIENTTAREIRTVSQQTDFLERLYRHIIESDKSVGSRLSRVMN